MRFVVLDENENCIDPNCAEIIESSWFQCSPLQHEDLYWAIDDEGSLMIVDDKGQSEYVPPGVYSKITVVFEMSEDECDHQEASNGRR